jgi:ribosomal-protein-alanine N-acetyltransferase
MECINKLIIPAELHHLEEIVTIENSAFNKPWTRNQIKNDIQSDTGSENWVYIMDKLVAGYIIGCISHDEFHLNNIAVHPEYLRRSIGKKLIRHIISRVISYNIKVILLEVSANNIPAQKCYNFFRFTQVGIRKDYYSKGDDAILYNLDLTKNG